MKVLSDNKCGIRIKIEDSDDMWYVSNIVESGDIITAKTVRKVKKNGDGERANISKRAVVLTITVEKIDFDGDNLRASGTIQHGPDDIPIGSYHSMQLNTEFTLKKNWTHYSRELLNEALTQRRPTLIVLFDREEALYAITQPRGFSVLAHIKGEVAKKDPRSIATGNFYKQIAHEAKVYQKRYNPKFTIIACPSFFKHEIERYIKGVFTTCDSIKKSSIKEILLKDEVKTALADSRAAAEHAAVDQILKKISTDGKVAYGIKEVKDAVDAGAVKLMVVTDTYIKSAKETGDYNKLNDLIKKTAAMQAKVMILSSDAIKQVDALGGIAVVLRFIF